MEDKNKFMEEAIRLSINNVASGKGGPFGAVVVKSGKIIGKGVNSVTSTNDPTAHAEVVAIRDACRTLGSFQLDGCELFTSCEPCPMCVGAIYWARPEKVYYGNTAEDAAAIGFDDQFICEELNKEKTARLIPMIQMMREESQEAFRAWKAKTDKIEY
ncbi:MAG: nucleoside deaminase [Patescibacteria group bacterium]